MTDDSSGYPEYRPRSIDLERLNEHVRSLQAQDCGDAATLIVELLDEVVRLRLENERLEIGTRSSVTRFDLGVLLRNLRDAGALPRAFDGLSELSCADDVEAVESLYLQIGKRLEERAAPAKATPVCTDPRCNGECGLRRPAPPARARRGSRR